MNRTVITIILVMVTIAFLVELNGCDQIITKKLGGTTTIDLEPGQKLEIVTWKDMSLWLQVRKRREGEKPETHVFLEHSKAGLLQGKVIIQEK